MDLRRLKNESGMILVVVIAFIVVISILVAGMLSRNVTTTVALEDQTKSIQADLLTRGAFWKFQNYIDQSIYPSTGVMTTSWTEQPVAGGVIYTVTISRDAGNKISVKVSY